MKIDGIIHELKNYKGRKIKLMEVCGTHTASIFKNGIRSLISPEIQLISGPGCPVCVTPASYIDRCIAYAKKEKHVVITFGDMMKVPGENGSLAQAKGEGAAVELMYSPTEVIEKAVKHPELTYVIAAVGFETTVPAYALTVEEAIVNKINNIRFLTALKRIAPALQWICKNESDIDGFICPGHVSVIIGSDSYRDLCIKYKKPFTVAGFEAEHLLAAIFDIVMQIQRNEHEVHNLYPEAVRPNGNIKGRLLIDKYFEECPAIWRGLGLINDSGLYLRDEYEDYDGGSKGLDRDAAMSGSCRCGDVITGRIRPDECMMFGEYCNPINPYGPCMVSSEGACGIWYRNR